MKASKIKIVAWLLAGYVGLTILVLLLLWGAYSIPREKLYPQVVQSNVVLQAEGEYPTIPLFGHKVRDNYSDACMLNVAFCSEEGTALDNLKNAMRSDEPIEGGELDGLKEAIRIYPFLPECFSYSRYWHGYQMYLRPLLTVFDLRQIRIVNYILLISLACLVLVMFWRKLGVWYAITMALGLLAVAFPIVPKCLHFSAIFYVGFISMMCALYLPKSKNESILRPLLFFMAGAMTSCLDLLTAPMIPLVLLLITDSLSHSYTGTRWEQFRDRMTDLIGFGLLWCLGYAIFWITKFAIGSIILDSNLFVDAFSQTSARMDASYASFTDWVIKVILLPIKHNYILALAEILVVYILCRWEKYSNAILANAWLLLVAMIEPIWLLLLRQHTMIHYSIFVWRSEIILILCLAIFAYRVIMQTKGNEKPVC